MRCLGLISLAIIALPAVGAIVDRTAIAVGTKVITESDIIRRIRLEAFQNGTRPDYGLTSRREAAQRLIDLKLVEHEMDLGHYPGTSPEAAKELLDAFAAERFPSSAEALRLALADLDLTPADLQAELAEQADLLSFTSLRLRPAVQISDQEIEEYYHNHIESASATPIPLAEVRAKIEDILINQRADLNLDAWLQDQRKRARIIYLVKELQ
jgi:hypothetical protein